MQVQHVQVQQMQVHAQKLQVQVRVQVQVQMQVQVQVQVLLPDIHPWKQPSPSPAWLPPPRPLSASWRQETPPG